MNTNLDLKDTIHFDPVREHRGTYFVTYDVPDEGDSIASLQLVYPRAAS